MGREETERVHVKWFQPVNSVLFPYKGFHVLMLLRILSLLMKYSIKTKSFIKVMLFAAYNK